jgi:purine-binding chemotaxis protein CheW
MADILDHQFLTLTLAGERYAVPVGRVREVLEPTRVTKLPCSAPYLKGIIDIRGRGVAVVDLRLRFGMTETVIGADTAIVVVETGPQGSAGMVGLMTDAVHEVVELDAGNLEASPGVGTGLSADYIDGIGRQEGSFVFVMNLDRILEESELPGVEGAAILK